MGEGAKAKRKTKRARRREAGEESEILVEDEKEKR